MSINFNGDFPKIDKAFLEKARTQGIVTDTRKLDPAEIGNLLRGKKSAEQQVFQSDRKPVYSGLGDTKIDDIIKLDSELGKKILESEFAKEKNRRVPGAHIGTSESDNYVPVYEVFPGPRPVEKLVGYRPMTEAEKIENIRGKNY